MHSASVYFNLLTFKVGIVLFAMDCKCCGCSANDIALYKEGFYAIEDSMCDNKSELVF